MAHIVCILSSKYAKYISCTLYLIISLYKFPSWFIVYAGAVILEGEFVFDQEGFNCRNVCRSLD